MQEKEILAGNLDLMTGYRAGRDGVVVTLKDSGGCLVARLPGRVTPDGPTAPGQERQGTREAHLTPAYSHYVESTVLREREVELGERLEQVEEERRDTSDRIAQDLYQFFYRMARRVASRKRLYKGKLEGELHGCQ